jgi:hypothetical protein
MATSGNFDNRFEFDELQNVQDINGIGAMKSVQQRQLNALVNLGLISGTPASPGLVGTTQGTLVGGHAALGQGTLPLLGAMYYTVLASDFTLTNGTAAQKAFNSSANGAITLKAGFSYYFEAFYFITNTGTTAHTWSVLFGGTATYTSIVYSIVGNSLTAAGTGVGVLFGMGNSAAAFVATPSSTSATENAAITLQGVITINAGGTVIPQVQLSAAPGGTQLMKAGSNIVFYELAGQGAVGAWS